MVGIRRVRPSFPRFAATLMVLTILPMAAFAGAALARSAAPAPTLRPSDITEPPLYGTAGFDAATLDALQRGRASDLFASFEWTGFRVRGSFLEFGYNLANGTMTNVTAKAGQSHVVLVSSVQIEDFHPTEWPEARGPQFTAPAISLLVRARDDPMTSLEFLTNGTARRLTFVLPSNVSEVATHWRPDSWPASSVMFSIGDTQGLLALGSGTFEVAGLTVVARMTSTDLLLLKSTPSFSSQRPERTALLDAIGSGRLAAETSLVAMADGQFIESKVGYRLVLTATPDMVLSRHAVVRINGTGDGAVVLLAFDPRTMPAGASDRLTVRVNGAEIAETKDTLNTFYASATEWDKPFYARLPLAATAVAVYLPSLASMSISVRSIPLTTNGPILDAASQAAMVLALGLVSIAAAHMFRRRRA